MAIAARRLVMLITAVLAGCALATAPALAVPQERVPDGPGLARQLVRQVDGVNAMRHLVALQLIADAHGGNRAAGTPGYDASVHYVASLLRTAGFDVTTPAFDYEAFIVDAQRLTVGAAEVPIVPMTYSPSTDADGISAPLAVVPESDPTPGCEIGDYAGLPVAGAIAVIRRGVCPFAQKQQVAADAGAAAALISNNEPGPLNGTLGDSSAGRIPTAGISQADGDALAAQPGAAATLVLVTRVENRTSRNVIAQTRTGRPDNVVMAGAHLDSVPEGPGINDNGTGTAALLETALQLGSAPRTTNAVRFAWWGAEEAGLLGSTAYVEQLAAERQLDIAMYLNFDMVGSPNAAYFVYDGDDSDTIGAGPGPAGSAQIERTFADFHAFRGVPTEGTDFDGRSDYGPFIAVGIPAGGLFTGAEGIKTPEQAAKWGGTAGVAYDPCYHQACDKLSNPRLEPLDRNGDAIAWTVGFYASSTEGVNGVPSRTERRLARAGAVAALATTSG